MCLKNAIFKSQRRPFEVKVGNTEKSIIKQHLCFSITFHGFLMWQFFVICAEVVIRDLVVFVVIISNQFHSTFPSTNEILLGRCNLVMIASIAQFRDLKIDFQNIMINDHNWHDRQHGWSHMYCYHCNFVGNLKLPLSITSLDFIKWVVD